MPTSKVHLLDGRRGGPGQERLQLMHFWYVGPLGECAIDTLGPKAAEAEKCKTSFSVQKVMVSHAHDQSLVELGIRHGALQMLASHLIVTASQANGTDTA